MTKLERLKWNLYQMEVKNHERGIRERNKKEVLKELDHIQYMFNPLMAIKAIFTK